ncbi:hypothetical protein UPYG_G00121510 [Umbra pygmaea]|uniref:Zinc finger and BTB domain-containing protein 21 n=1 Tax=Umbra pygmaea TaxID=75934 RepID=A0ABD0X8G8_UMBPY
MHRVRMESLVHYSNSFHSLSVLGVLNEQRLRGHLCDTVLVVGDQRYQAHRSVLAACSEYFQSLFTGKESEPHKLIHLDFCEPDAFEIVLNFIYSSSLFVERGSLAAIQELGYSLGIPYLTNIMSSRPHVSYSVSRKRVSVEDDRQPRSVIVHQSRGGDNPSPSRYCSNYQGEQGQRPGHRKPNESARNIASNTRSAESIGEGSNSKPISSYASILKGKASSNTGASLRPQLTSSVSFSESPTVMAQTNVSTEEEGPRLSTLKPPSQEQTGEPSQTIDRSGPLIKSLLRRSLSMDSPIPVFSPTLELKELQVREQSVVKMVATTEEGTQTLEQKHRVKVVPPLLLRSRQHTRYEDETQGEEYQVKTEPSSPLSDPSEIIKITVGDALPVNLKDIDIHLDQGSTKPLYNLPVKRKVRRDNRRYPFKKSKGLKEHDPPREDDEDDDEDDMSESGPHNSKMDDNDGDWTGEPRQSKMFKCWNCLKVFRSTAGLHRHVNMYHNPEKPYACEICHKRFHTNFKVWTHGQTQHGVMQNPASSSSSFQLDEKFQRKLIDIVRERDIKKALLLKLRKNKQSLQSQGFAKKGGLRLRSNLICPYCGKTFVFLSQFKQHLKTHPTETANQEIERECRVYQKDQPGQIENTDPEVYSCRLCNEKLSSLFEQGDHERGCRHATVCPYCGLRFSSPVIKKDHEAHCKYKKLTCLECMRTFKSSFSIWRHQVEVHNHNIMTVKEQLSHQEEINGEVSDHVRRPPVGAGSSRDDLIYSDSSGPPLFDSEDSSSFLPEDLSVSQHHHDHHGELTVKEEPMEEAVSTNEDMTSGASMEPEEPGVWPCEKCGKLFSGHKDLERHQELLCHIKPFICHICNKAFRTNFRLWSHFQTHMSASELGAREIDDRRPSSSSPSPPPPPAVVVTQATRNTSPQVSPPKQVEKEPEVAKSVVGELEDKPGRSSSLPRTKRPEMDRSHSSPLPKTDSVDNPLKPQESETLFYHAPTLSALTFKRQYMCKLCHRTFKTAFSLWSHEQSHSHI